MKTKIIFYFTAFWHVQLLLILLLVIGLPPPAFSQYYTWAKRGGVNTGNDEGHSIAVDGSGNSYITGYFFGTVDFDPGAGTANLTSAGDYDIFFAKYDPSGNYLWAKNIGTNIRDEGMDITLDASGNIYITGYFGPNTVDFDPGAGTANLTSVGNNDIFFAKYDASGNYIWANNIGSVNNDYGNSIAVDGYYVYISGNFGGTADFDPGAGTSNLTPASSEDSFFAKYNSSDGSYVWAMDIASTSGIGEAYGISVDPSGNVYITGTFSYTADFDPGAGTANLTANGGGSNFDIYLAKYDASGNYIWAENFGSSTAGEEIGWNIAVDASNVYITGYINGIVDFDPGGGTANVGGSQAIFFAKYNVADGSYVWAKKISSGGIEEGRDIAVDGGGDVYITGTFDGTADFNPGAGTFNLTPTGNNDVFFARYNSSGNFVWAAKIGSTSTDRGKGIAVSSCNVYLTGFFRNTADFDPSAGVANLTSAGSEDFYFAKYGCTPLPVELIYFNANCADHAVRLQWQTASEENNDYFTIERSLDGINFELIGIVKGAGNSSTIKNYELVDSKLETLNPELKTLFYRLRQTDYNGQYEYYGPVSVNLAGCKPNTVTVFPTISSNGCFTITGKEKGDIAVYDLCGKKIYETFTQSPGSSVILNLSSQPSGVYFLNIKTEQGILSKKIILQK